MEKLQRPLCKEVKKSQKKKKTGESGAPYVSKWKYYEFLSFLTDTVRHRE